jgi:hypothetical protein
VVRLPLILWFMSLKATQCGSPSCGESHGVGISLIMGFCLVRNPLLEGEEDEYLGVTGEGGNVVATLIAELVGERPDEDLIVFPPQRPVRARAPNPRYFNSDFVN